MNQDRMRHEPRQNETCRIRADTGHVFELQTVGNIKGRQGEDILK